MSLEEVAKFGARSGQVEDSGGQDDLTVVNEKCDEVDILGVPNKSIIALKPEANTEEGVTPNVPL